jgi:hypothetical protein
MATLTAAFLQRVSERRTVRHTHVSSRYAALKHQLTPHNRVVLKNLLIDQLQQISNILWNPCFKRPATGFQTDSNKSGTFLHVTILYDAYTPTKTVNPFGICSIRSTRSAQPTTSFHRQKIVFNNLTIQKYVTRASFWKTPLRALGSKYTTRGPPGEHISSWTAECFPHVDRNILLACTLNMTACLYSKHDSVIENSLLMSVHTDSNNAHYELAWK